MDSIFDEGDPLSFLGEDAAAEAPESEPAPAEPAEGQEAEEASNEPKTHRDLQRGALQELVELVTECAAHEAEVEKQLQSSLSEAQGSGQKKLTDAERKYKSLQEQVANKVQEKQSQIEARYQQSTAALKSSDHTLRIRAARNTRRPSSRSRRTTTRRSGLPRAFWRRKRARRRRS